MELHKAEATFSSSGVTCFNQSALVIMYSTFIAKSEPRNLACKHNVLPRLLSLLYQHFIIHRTQHQSPCTNFSHIQEDISCNTTTPDAFQVRKRRAVHTVTSKKMKNFLYFITEKKRNFYAFICL